MQDYDDLKRILEPWCFVREGCRDDDPVLVVEHFSVFSRCCQLKLELRVSLVVTCLVTVQSDFFGFLIVREKFRKCFGSLEICDDHLEFFFALQRRVGVLGQFVNHFLASDCVVNLSFEFSTFRLELANQADEDDGKSDRLIFKQESWL